MIGAIIGDITGSTLEFKRNKKYDFPIFIKGSDITDDAIMTIAVARALMQLRKEGGDLHESMRFHMRDLGRKYPYPKGYYGTNFKSWLRSNSGSGWKIVLLITKKESARNELTGFAPLQVPWRVLYQESKN